MIPAAALALALAQSGPIYGPEYRPSEMPTVAPPPPNQPALTAPAPYVPPVTLPLDAPGIVIETAESVPETTVDLSAGPRISAVGDSPAMELTLRAGRVTPLWGNRLQARYGLMLRGVTASSRTEEQTNSAAGIVAAPMAGLAVGFGGPLSLYGDIGAGLALYRSQSGVQFYGDYTALTPGFEISAAVGATYRVSNLVSLFFEPLGLRLHDAGPAQLEVGDEELQFPTSPTANFALRLGVGIHL